jgi:CheY-like chemotaxis protein
MEIMRSRATRQLSVVSPWLVASRLRVLVAEDDGDSAEALLMVLERAGYEATAVSRAGEALERLRGKKRPDVLLLDLSLADVGGAALVDAFVRAAPLPPTIVISAATERTLREAAERLHAHGALRKPFGTDGLLRAVAVAAAATPARASR